ncbi:LysR family transcriptional regulator [Pseudophaeobacter profundi]|uniref:LysR family transcriptional regulator n=1 Tax=Pseudophaeobacter profundi TaxID=3034152 RepID=UPI00242C36E0|nr:LysR family transcriptional regulator [Pseudophaeobacter profundi]
MKKTNVIALARPQRRQLPNLKALRAFEAVAFHGSFTRAADELAVSQGAVSHQVRQLEEGLGVSVFLRGAKGVSLTEEGKVLQEVCERSFDKIAESTALIRRDRKDRVLRVRVGPFFAMKVIAPRVAGFLEQNPGVQLHLTNLEVDAPPPGAGDIQIKYCLEPPAGCHAIEVFRERQVPVCSPELLQTVRDPVQLLEDPQVPRLHYRDLAEWQAWLDGTGLGAASANSNLIFDDQHTILAAVRSGQGVGLADRALISEDVERGRVCIVSENSVEPEISYKFICGAGRNTAGSLIETFRIWLMSELEGLEGT